MPAAQPSVPIPVLHRSLVRVEHELQVARLELYVEHALQLVSREFTRSPKGFRRCVPPACRGGGENALDSIPKPQRQRSRDDDELIQRLQRRMREDGARERGKDHVAAALALARADPAIAPTRDDPWWNDYPDVARGSRYIVSKTYKADVQRLLPSLLQPPSTAAATPPPSLRSLPLALASPLALQTTPQSVRAPSPPLAAAMRPAALAATTHREVHGSSTVTDRRPRPRLEVRAASAGSFLVTGEGTYDFRDVLGRERGVWDRHAGAWVLAGTDLVSIAARLRSAGAHVTVFSGGADHASLRTRLNAVGVHMVFREEPPSPEELLHMEIDSMYEHGSLARYERGRPDGSTRCAALLVSTRRTTACSPP